MPQDDDKLNAFLAVTSADPELAQQLLDSNQGDLEKAIESYFAINEAQIELDHTPTQTPVVDTSSEDALPHPHAPPSVEDDEEEVIPVRRREPRRRSSNGGPQRETNRDSGHPNHVGFPENLTEGRLGELYAPPSDLNFEDSYEQALRKGREESKWVLVNLQQNENFLCLLLNREVWSDSTIKEFIQSSFIFWQRDVLSEDAMQFCARYSVNSFPFVAVIDPRTGEKVLEPSLEENDRIEKNYIVSNLCNFLETNVLDEWTAPRGSRRSGAVHSNSHSLRSFPVSNDSAEDEARDSWQQVDENEDAQLAEAIAASLEDQEGPSSSSEMMGYGEFYTNEVPLTRNDSESRIASQYASMTDPHLTEERELKMEQDAALAAAEAADRARLSRVEEEERQRLWQKEMEQKQQEELEALEATKHMRQRMKKSVLKDEPAENSPHVTELLLRLPDGRKVVRRFQDNEPLQAVVDFVVYETGLSEEEFQLIIPYPRKVLADLDVTLEQLNLTTKAALIVERN
ncbi:UBX domain-containing protein 7 [Galdieria sulphuraria]|uniref:UBX domain-containing protein n=1 Tax=Galdieria sulphuraria TaxID=130081 RepID=M2XTQ1_GALSU|nr:uncharacterized protein Gasu_53780 [Galdieria sulphuraria]EME27043.1 hypothetical protein Gasu_53780 [Galdieria sulphuraria]GJD11140.1 UBX domain-containing protein 7 [Galdieria sulphuraria]|eukprot:XP_005703563.1 hypothetical protein Gasu_53780 [Galdieria sulphuraria]